MTLIIGFSSPWSAAISSDRLVTLAHPRNRQYRGDHDTVANKLIILVTVDAAVILGYAGSAYIGKIPTDEWIAETVSPGAQLRGSDGSAAMLGLKRYSKLRLHQAFNRIRLGLAKYPEGADVSIVSVGWRIRRRLKVPINVVLRASNTLSGDSQLTLRPTWPLPCRIQHIGANIDLYSRLRHAANKIMPWQPDTVISCFTEIIRETAETDATVGPHVMSAVLRFCPANNIRHAESLFDPSIPHLAEREILGIPSSQIVNFTPWFLTPTAFHSPSESTGVPSSASTFHVGGWTFTARPIPDHPSTPARIGWMMPQQRKPPP